jgi:hypothetical protein
MGSPSWGLLWCLVLFAGAPASFGPFICKPWRMYTTTHQGPRLGPCERLNYPSSHWTRLFRTTGTMEALNTHSMLYQGGKIFFCKGKVTVLDLWATQCLSEL